MEKNWFDSKAYCEIQNSTLVIISSLNEHVSEKQKFISFDAIIIDWIPSFILCLQNGPKHKTCFLSQIHYS